MGRLLCLLLCFLFLFSFIEEQKLKTSTRLCLSGMKYLERRNMYQLWRRRMKMLLLYCKMKMIFSETSILMYWSKKKPLEDKFQSTEMLFKFGSNEGAGKMAQKLRTFPALRENSSSVPSIQVRWFTASWNSRSRESNALQPPQSPVHTLHIINSCKHMHTRKLHEQIFQWGQNTAESVFPAQELDWTFAGAGSQWTLRRYLSVIWLLWQMTMHPVSQRMPFCVANALKVRNAN